MPLALSQRSHLICLPRLAGSLALALGLVLPLGQSARARSPASAPSELTQLLSTIERAANRGNAQQLKQLYGARFERSGGLERSQLVAGLSQLHQRYEQLQYDIQLQSWQRRGRGFVTTTETHVTGKRQGEHRTFRLDARLRSRQRLADRTVTRQTILSERTELTAGSNPPQVRINLPATVAPGERFHFDAIATQPLGDAVLLGSATMQAVSGQRYLQPPPLELQPLPAGGLYKVGQAPKQTGSHWLSAVLVRQGGMTAITRRLRVVSPSQ